MSFCIFICVKQMLALPNEVLSLILSFLPSKDLYSASLTCKLLNQLSQSDQIWSKRCYHEFKLDIPPSKGMTRIFFQKGKFLNVLIF